MCYACRSPPASKGASTSSTSTPTVGSVAAGGWTGWDFDGKASIYLFDVDTGELVRRIGGFPETIGTLAFSPDGRHLAVGLHGAQGLRVLRTSDYAEVTQDTEYGDRILDLDFAPDGRLAVRRSTATSDSTTSATADWTAKDDDRATTAVDQVLAQWPLIAVGFNDLAPPAIYLSADLTLSDSVDASSIRDQQRLQNIQWSDRGCVLCHR